MKKTFFVVIGFVVFCVGLLFVLPTWMKKEMDGNGATFSRIPIITIDTSAVLEIDRAALKSKWTDAVSASPAYQYQDPLIAEIKKLRKELLVAIEKNKCNHPMLFAIPLELPPIEIDTSEMQLLQQYGN